MHTQVAFYTGHLLFGSWFVNVKSWWLERDHPNVKIVFYEDMIDDCERSIEGIAQFLGVSLTDEQTRRVARECAYDNMKKKGVGLDREEDAKCISESQFYRKG